MEIVNERSTPITRVEFKDENGDAVIPSEAFYRIDDLGSGDAIREETEIEIDSPAIAQADVRWAQTDTIILNQSHLFEIRRMTVWWSWGSGSPAPFGTQQFFLRIKNLGGILTSSPA